MKMQSLFIHAAIAATLHWAAYGQMAPNEVKGTEVKRPEITQNEILEALDLEIAKIRIVNIPKGQDVRIELEEWTEKHLKSRRLAKFSAKPDSDWIELLISAHTPADGCRRIKMAIHHESPIFWDWTLDIEKQFGAGTRAIPMKDRRDMLNFDSNTYRYEGQQLEIASFRLNGKNTGKRYMINLNAFPELVLSNKRK